MAGHGGARKGAGRPFGSKNKATKERIAAAMEDGQLLPHDEVAVVAFGPNVDAGDRIDQLSGDAHPAAAPAH